MPTNPREKIAVFVIYFAFALIVARLFYWQIIKGAQLQAVADNQYSRTIVSDGSRGAIYSADGYPLVLNETVFRLFAQPHVLNKEPREIAAQLAPILLEEELLKTEATESAQTTELLKNITQGLEDKLSKPDSRWVALYSNLSRQTRDQIIELNIHGIGFDAYEVRNYPEASLAAHITGFVGKDEKGEDLGYFGLEGALEKELQARSSFQTVITDALGFQLVGGSASSRPIDGRNINTTIRRDVQNLVEQYLIEGVEKYGAKSGEIVVMEPSTGKILAVATYPSYDQIKFYDYDTSLYKNPSLADLYEPGSTFKVLTVAAGIDSGKITSQTVCTNCSGPRQYGKYSIKTWNDVYNPNINMEEALAKSDNTAMIFAAELMGADTFKKYIKDFGIGDQLNIELQEDRITPFPERWGPVELATSSFGQGISTNSMQLTRAVAVIANKGKMMKPIIVEKVENPSTGEIITTPIQLEREVVSRETAQQVTEMMINAAQHGEAQWIASKTHTIAGKTGTSQIASGGEYAADRTIASFIGFASPENPKFVMLVKLVEPSSSPWAAETAAPLWYKIADRLYLLFNIAPDR